MQYTWSSVKGKKLDFSGIRPTEKTTIQKPKMTTPPNDTLWTNLGDNTSQLLPGPLPENQTGSEENAHVTTLAEFYINVVYLVIGVIGSMGNISVLVVIFSLTKMRQKLTNIFIINQAFTDAVAAISLIGTTLHFWHLKSLAGMSGFGGELLCRLWLTKFPLWASLFASTNNLVAVTIERYLEVIHPISHKVQFTKEKAVFIIVLIWIFSFAFQGSWIISTSGLAQDHCVLLGFWSSNIWKNGIGFINVMLQFFFPIAILTYCYTKMAFALKNRIVPASSAGDQGINNNERLRRNMFKTLAAVSAVFGLCWVSNQTLFLIYSLGYPIDFSSSFYHFSIIMVFANCCINPFIYAAKYKEFQKGISQLMIKSRLMKPKNAVGGQEMMYAGPSSIGNLDSFGKGRSDVYNIDKNTKFLTVAAPHVRFVNTSEQKSDEILFVKARTNNKNDQQHPTPSDES